MNPLVSRSNCYMYLSHNIFSKINLAPFLGFPSTEISLLREKHWSVNSLGMKGVLGLNHMMCSFSTTSYHQTSSCAFFKLVCQVHVGKLVATEEDSQPVRSFKVKEAAAVRRRWDLDSLNVTQVPLLATALDPRFHHLNF